MKFDYVLLNQRWENAIHGVREKEFIRFGIDDEDESRKWTHERTDRTTERNNAKWKREHKFATAPILNDLQPSTKEPMASACVCFSVDETCVIHILIL